MYNISSFRQVQLSLLFSLHLSLQTSKPLTLLISASRPIRNQNQSTGGFMSDMNTCTSTTHLNILQNRLLLSPTTTVLAESNPHTFPHDLLSPCPGYQNRKGFLEPSPIHRWRLSAVIFQPSRVSKKLQRVSHSTTPTTGSQLSTNLPPV